MDNPPALFNAVFALVIGLIVIFAVGTAAYYLYNLAQETVTRKVKVVAKRTSFTQATGQNPAQTTYYCTFEFEDGQRAEYHVGVRQYGLIAEGDRGELDTKGALFWDFRRPTA